jgi:peptide/nickel transport system ATP-binding protein
MLELPARPPDESRPELIRTAKLSKHFRIGGPLSRRFLHGVDDVDLVIREDEIVALVGESGSGKSTIARLIAMVYTPTGGEIFHRGRSLASLRSRQAVLEYRGHVPMVFQDPYSSLSPVYRVAHGIMRALKLHRGDLSRQGREAEAERLVEAVGLVPGRDFLAKFPYELSGGQRQRIGFATALACRPELILADEPVSMLDVSVRIGVLNLMASLRRRERISFLYITHDIASARYVADRIVVMYAGQVAESGPVEDVLRHPKHPYTQLLLSAVPDPRAPVGLPDTAEVQEPPRVIDPGEGCRFLGRCPYAIDTCFHVTPRLRELRPAHEASCHVATSDIGGSEQVAQPAHT